MQGQEFNIGEAYTKQQPPQVKRRFWQAKPKTEPSEFENQ